MIHPHTELRPAGREIGYGVYATRSIPAGTVTWVRDALDRTLQPEELRAYPAPFQPLLEKYTYRDADGNFILLWDHARYMNHSCSPNCAGTGHDFEVAVRDIAAGEELTVDYAALNLQDHEAFPCLCGSKRCRGTVTAEDAARLTEHWRHLMRRALPRLAGVPQPLADLVEPPLLVAACDSLGLDADLTGALAAHRGA